MDKEIPEFNNTDGIALTIKWECEVKAKDKAIFKILNKEPMVRAAWKTKKIVAPKKEVNKPKDKPLKTQASEEKPRLPEVAKEKKTSQAQYNQIYGR